MVHIQQRAEPRTSRENCDGLSEKGPHRLTCLTTWSPVGGTVWEVTRPAGPVIQGLKRFYLYESWAREKQETKQNSLVKVSFY